MKRFAMIPVLALCMVMVLGVSHASAIGLGTFYQVGWGSADWEDDYDNRLYDDSLDHRGRMPGFVFDTNVAKDRLFNYRLTLGLDQMKFDGRGKANGYVMDHIFGFGVLRHERVRVWIGPQLHLSYYDDAKFDKDFNLFGFGVGPAFGINIHAGDHVSFCITNGFLYIAQVGDTRSDSFSGTETLFYLNFSVLFRINDVYRAAR